MFWEYIEGQKNGSCGSSRIMCVSCPQANNEVIIASADPLTNLPTVG